MDPRGDRPGGDAARRAAGWPPRARAILLDPRLRSRAGSLPLPGAGEIVLIVGPEGGISPAEAAALASAGAVPPGRADGAARVIGRRGGGGGLLGRPGAGPDQALDLTGR